MSAAFVLNRENALKLADLMSLLPQDIANEIHEFNADHAEKWRQVMSSALRHVHCPSYFHAAEDEIYWQRTTHDWTIDEFVNRFRCFECGKRHDGAFVLGAMRWQRMTGDTSGFALEYCDECERERAEYAEEEDQGESEWDDFDPNVDFDFERNGTSDYFPNDSSLHEDVFNYDIDESDFDL